MIDRLASTLAVLLILAGAALAVALLIVLALIVRTPAVTGWVG